MRDVLLAVRRHRVVVLRKKCCFFVRHDGLMAGVVGGVMPSPGLVHGVSHGRRSAPAAFRAAMGGRAQRQQRSSERLRRQDQHKQRNKKGLQPTAHCASISSALPFQRRSSNAFETTLTLLKAMAAPAMTGLSSPTAASGTPTTL